jgi:hypothetical protein
MPAVRPGRREPAGKAREAFRWRQERFSDSIAQSNIVFGSVALLLVLRIEPGPATTFSDILIARPVRDA